MHHTWHEYRGNIHMHTTRSDGSGSHAELAAAARAAGLDFLIVTDHNVLAKEEARYRDGVLMLVDEEVHDEARPRPGNHLLCFNVNEELSRHASNPQELIDAVNDQGGFSFLAHPLERNTRFLPETYPWEDWWVQGYTGIELWNFMSEFRAYAPGRLRALLMSFFPRLLTTGPWPETLHKWDALLRERPIVAIGGSDAHAQTYHLGPIPRLFLPYERCFRSVNTHILTPEPFTGDFAHDRDLVYAALKSGRCWVGYDLPAPTDGFRFTATNEAGEQAIMGSPLEADGMLRLRVHTSQPAHIRLLRDGELVAGEQGRELNYASQLPGVYRVEVWKRWWFKPRGWIFSNPIYAQS